MKRIHSHFFEFVWGFARIFWRFGDLIGGNSRRFNHEGKKYGSLAFSDFFSVLGFECREFQQSEWGRDEKGS